ncbi:unnamed protein product [Lampetra fluviatilis]
MGASTVGASTVRAVETFSERRHVRISLLPRDQQQQQHAVPTRALVLQQGQQSEIIAEMHGWPEAQMARRLWRRLLLLEKHRRRGDERLDREASRDALRVSPHRHPPPPPPESRPAAQTPNRRLGHTEERAPRDGIVTPRPRVLSLLNAHSVNGIDQTFQCSNRFKQSLKPRRGYPG